MLPGIILASGYGSLASCQGVPRPKVLETVGDKPMLLRVVETARNAGLGPLVVVVNELFGPMIREVVAAPDVIFATQPNRYGAADAILRGMEALPANSHDVIVLYGDMPLWTAETVSRLARSHLRHNAMLSLAPVFLITETRDAKPHLPAAPLELRRYGRVLRDARNNIRAVLDPCEEGSNEVNPSLWAFDRRWFRARFESIPAVPRRDGFPAERSPQPLVSRAYLDGLAIGETEVFDPREALGVNSLPELQLVNSLLGKIANR